jgi:hypothetical protein
MHIIKRLIQLAKDRWPGDPGHPWRGIRRREIDAGVTNNWNIQAKLRMADGMEDPNMEVRTLLLALRIFLPGARLEIVMPDEEVVPKRNKKSKKKNAG